MKRAALSAAFVVVMLSVLAAQKPGNPPQRPIPQASSTSKPTQYAMTARGRIDNRRLTLSPSEAAKLPFEMLRGTEFRLDGTRELLQLIRGHNGHCDEISGVVSVPPARRPVVSSVEAKKLGPFSVGVGGRESIGADGAPRVLTLKVESVTHFGEPCDER